MKEPTEIWKPIPGFEGFYDVSSFGRVKSLPRVDCRGQERKERILKLIPDNGYHIVTLCKDRSRRNYGVHSLVLAAFVGPRPSDLECAHGNGDKHDNRLGNLRYATALENADDRFKHGRSANGEKHGMATLNTGDVQSIRRRWICGDSIALLAKHFNVSKTHISRIINHKSWKSV